MRSAVAAALFALAAVAALLGGGSPAVAAGGAQRIMTSAPARVDLPGAPHTGPTADAALRAYWTPRRMRQAVHHAAVRDGTATSGLAAQAAAAGLPDGHGPVATVDTVGKLFFTYPGGQPSVCSGSVLNTSAETLVLTAAHCLEEGGPNGQWHTNFLFVPAYDGSAAPPLGSFAVWNVASDSLWASDADENHDYGIAITYDNSLGEHVADAAGAFDIVSGHGTVNEVTIIGYPSEGAYDGKHQEYCKDLSEPTPVPRNLIMARCPNMVGGSSGSPWLLDYDPVDQVGEIYGVNAVFDGTYIATPRFDDRTLQLVAMVNQLAAARP